MPERVRQRTIVTLLLFVWSALTLFAQGVGSTEQDVLKHYGAPQMERAQSGGKKLWIYPNGTRLVIANGVVVESNVSTSQPAPQPDLRPRYTPPPKPVVMKKPEAPASKTQAQSLHRGHGASGSLISEIGGLALLLIIVGFIIGMIGGIWFIVVSFQTSILWGLVCLLIPMAHLVFLIVHWRDAKMPWAVNALGAVVMILGFVAGAFHSGA